MDLENERNFAAWLKANSPLYKWLSAAGESVWGGNCQWSLPRDGHAGEWMPPVEGSLQACLNGYHLCREQDLMTWISESCYEAEARGTFLVSKTKVVVSEARLLRKLNWSAESAARYALECAEYALPRYEESYTYDRSVRNLLVTARDYLNGKVPMAAFTDAKVTAFAFVKSTVVQEPAYFAANAAMEAWAAVYASTEGLAASAVHQARSVAGLTLRAYHWDDFENVRKWLNGHLLNYLRTEPPQ